MFHGETTIGGRYSVLSPFGLVPAAAMGIDVRTLARTRAADGALLRRGRAAGGESRRAAGACDGPAGLAGRDKVTIVASPEIADFGAWVEQLIAESTGKEGKGLIPIDGEPLGTPALYGNDRLFIDIRTDGETDAAHDDKPDALEKAGHPVVRIGMKPTEHLGQEFFRFEIATAVAGAILGINPFDQPDVEASKIKTRELTTAFERPARCRRKRRFLEDCGVQLFADETNRQAAQGRPGTLVGAGSRPISRAFGDGDYVALLAYIERNPRHTRALQHMRVLHPRRKRASRPASNSDRASCIRPGRPTRAARTAACSCRSPATTLPILPVPDQKSSFGVVKAAQARGDFDVLAEARPARAARASRPDLAAGLATLTDAVRQALRER